MSLCAPIKIDVALRDPETSYFAIDCTIDAPVLNWEPAPPVGFFQKKADPPARFVERRILVSFSFLFTEGYVGRVLGEPPEVRGLYDVIHNVNADIDPNIALSALSPFELVDAYAWDGRPPVSLMYVKGPMSGQALGTAPPLWDVATVNQVTGERVIATRTHARKDDAFKVLNRLNALVQYGHEVSNAFSHRFEDSTDFRDEVDAWCKENPPRFLPRK